MGLEGKTYEQRGAWTIGRVGDMDNQQFQQLQQQAGRGETDVVLTAVDAEPVSPQEPTACLDARFFTGPA